MTLIEVLAVCAIIALLLVFFAPVLGDLRLKAERTASLSNLRQHCQVFASYCIDYSGTYPYFTKPAADWTVLRSGTLRVRVRYFDAKSSWNIPLAAAYYDGACRSLAFLTPTQIRTSGGVPPVLSEYFYTNTLITDWQFWEPATRLDDRSQWRPVSDHQPKYPSKKGLFITPFSLFAPIEETFGRVEVGFLDGSAADLLQRELIGPYRLGTGAFPYADGANTPLPVVHTPGGYRGRDIQ